MKRIIHWIILFTAVITHSSCELGKDVKQHFKHQQHSENKLESNMKISKPNRVAHTYEQTINGTIEEIFPLYCPVRELDWAYGWNPKVVYSNSGLVEPDCVFITEHDGHETVWYVSVYDIEQGRVEMIRHTTGVTFTKLEIIVEPISEDKTKAVITYSKTSLSEIGDKVLKEFTKENYDIMMNSWEKEMNHYLKTGEMLTG